MCTWWGLLRSDAETWAVVSSFVVTTDGLNVTLAIAGGELTIVTLASAWSPLLRHRLVWHGMLPSHHWGKDHHCVCCCCLCVLANKPCTWHYCIAVCVRRQTCMLRYLVLTAFGLMLTASTTGGAFEMIIWLHQHHHRSYRQKVLPDGPGFVFSFVRLIKQNPWRWLSSFNNHSYW